MKVLKEYNNSSATYGVFDIENGSCIVHCDTLEEAEEELEFFQRNEENGHTYEIVRVIPNYTNYATGKPGKEYFQQAFDVVDGEQYDVAVHMMDDDIREDLHHDMAPCMDVEFLAAYMERHVEKYGEEFMI